MSDASFVVALLITLHAPDGHEIVLNTEAVVSMHEPAPGNKPGNFAPGAKCLINTADGKFMAVVEDCTDTVNNVLKQQREDDRHHIEGLEGKIPP